MRIFRLFSFYLLQAIKAVCNSVTTILLALIALIRQTIFWAIMIVFGIVCIPIFTFAAWSGIEYWRYSHRYKPSDACDFKNVVAPDINFEFIYDCIDARNYKEPNNLAFLLFMSRESFPSIDRTGHGWLGTVYLKRISDTWSVTDYRVQGFWGSSEELRCPPLLPTIVTFIRPYFNIPAIVEKNYKSFCLKGASGTESSVVVGPQNPTPLAPIPNTTELAKLLGNMPDRMLAVAVDANQYNNAKVSLKEWETRDYRPVLSDCTSLLYYVGSVIGLYTPPRILYPFPSDSVYAFQTLNIATVP